MATAEQIKALLKSHIEGDDSRFYSVAMQVAASEAKSGHTDFAAELRALIDKARENRALPLPPGTTIPMPRRAANWRSCFRRFIRRHAFRKAQGTQPPPSPAVTAHRPAGLRQNHDGIGAGW